MRLRSYRDRVLPAPSDVYCDSSFLLDAFVASDSRLLATTPSKGRAAAALGYLTWSRSQGTTFYASVLAVEECAHRLVLGPVEGEARKRGMRSWKVLRAQDVTGFQKMLNDNRSVFLLFHRWMEGQQIVLFGLRPGRAINDLTVAKKADLYAKALLRKHELDAMDAYQIAIARCAGLDWAASSDGDWQAAGRLDLVVP